MDRIALDTKQPEVLRELFEALGNDPAVIAECLARPVLTERLIGDLPAQDKSRHSESPRTNGLRHCRWPQRQARLPTLFRQLPGVDDPPCTGDTWTPTSIVWGGSADCINTTNTGGRYCAPTPRPTPTPGPRPTPFPRPTP
jgi:hypothetical protein